MYIRQTCLFSFEEIMNFQQETKLELILAQINISPLVAALSKQSHLRGPKGYRVAPMIYALIAKQILRISTTSELVRQLKENPVLRYNCGFEVLSKVPSEATFSRFADKLAESDALLKLFGDLVVHAKELGIVDGSHISIDSTKVDAFEASKPKKDIVDDGTNPNWGMKRDTHGNNIRWFGWKLHILSDSHSELPLSVMVTPANVHDGTIAVPLIEEFLKQYRDLFRPLFYAMDSGYDYNSVYDAVINHFEATPIIAYNPRGSHAAPEGLDDEFHPVCSCGYKLVYWGIDGDYMKFRCPQVLGKCNCPHGSAWCSSSNYGYTLKINRKENPRQIGYPLRSSDQWKTLYNKRTSVERCNGRLKTILNLNSIRSKGIKKATVHALLNCIALVAGTIASKVKVNRNEELLVA